MLKDISSHKPPQFNLTQVLVLVLGVPESGMLEHTHSNNTTQPNIYYFSINSFGLSCTMLYRCPIKSTLARVELVRSSIELGKVQIPVDFLLAYDNNTIFLVQSFTEIDSEMFHLHSILCLHFGLLSCIILDTKRK
jgi:hypothetical protein